KNPCILPFPLLSLPTFAVVFPDLPLSTPSGPIHRHFQHITYIDTVTYTLKTSSPGSADSFHPIRYT
ncbi:MAG: hypothetical protein ABI158_06175, partial [Edaphobacter sp.]